MRHIYRTAAILTILLNALALKAENITVTSKADRGPGTLWEAIERANINGTADRDYIRFNLPGTTIDDRTIILDKLELPALSSNIEIDGTTQPGTAFGISNAKVRILKTSLVGAGYFHMLKIYSAENVSVFGMYFEFRTSEEGAYAISLFNSNNVTIGEPNKGNVLIAAGGVIGSDIVTPGSSNGIHIANNIIGLEPDGITLANLQDSYPRLILWGAGQIEIDHNQICADVVIKESETQIATLNRVYQIHDNIFAGNADGSVSQGTGSIEIYAYPVSARTDIRAFLINNHILNGYVNFDLAYGEVKVQGNKINTDKSGGTSISEITNKPALRVYNYEGRGLIGGSLPEEKNYIASGYYGIETSYVGITISRNSIFCPKYAGITSAVTAYMKTFSGNTITGISNPESVIEIFAADKCQPGSDCTGKTYLGSTRADAAGNWSYTGTLPADVVITATNLSGSTSNFSSTWIDNRNIWIRPSICGSPANVTGIQAIGHVSVAWTDEDGNVVSNTEDLLNVPGGVYTLHATSTSENPLSACGTQTYTVDLGTRPPEVTAENAAVVHPCNGGKGSISDMTITGGYQNTFKWLNERDETVGTGRNLTDVPAGTYRLIVYASPTCFDVSDPIVISNQPGPVIDITNMTVTNSTCANSDGMISDIQLSGAGVLTARWLDANDAEIGRNVDIQNLASGVYRLEVTDQSACPAIISAPVTVFAVGAITMDVTGMTIRHAGCNNQPGSISGIVATGADTYTWQNRTGTIVGRTLDLTGVPAGDYMLTVNNVYNCSVQTVWIPVKNMQTQNWNVKAEIVLPVCNESNGRVTITDITGTQVSSVRWTNAATNATLGTDRTLNNLGPGDYKLYLTDPGGCELEVYTASIPRRTPPVLASIPQITAETCGRSNGAIRMPGVNGEGPYQVQWTDVSSALVSTEQDAKNLKAGSYYVEVMDKFGCTVKSNAYIVENNLEPLEPAADQAITVGKGLPIRINVAAPFPAIFTLYSDAATAFPLQQNITGTFVMPPLQQNATYYVTLSMDICKSPPAKIDVKAVDQVIVGVPTAFTPNGDGKNDIFRPQYSMMSSLEYFSVYSRWGNEVFTTKTMGMGWNGRMNGTDLPAGSYFYIIRGKDALGNPFQLQGSVVLMR